MKHRTTVIDISNLIWANYHKVVQYIPDGDPRQMTAVLVKTLQSVSVAVEGTNATQVFCATDIGSRAEYREQASPDYKSNRSDTPATIPASQLAMCGILDKYGIKSLTLDGYEADDIYAQIGYHWTQKGYGTVTGVSRDNDWTMAVAYNGGNVALYDQKTKKTLHFHMLADEAMEEFGQTISHEALYQYVRDSKTMFGDKSDVIESWPGVGKVTARNLARWQTCLDHDIQMDAKFADKMLKKYQKIGQYDYDRVLNTNRILIDPYHILTPEPVLEVIENYSPDPVELSEQEMDEMLYTPMTRCWARFNAYEARFNLIEGGDVENLPPYLRELLDPK